MKSNKLKSLMSLRLTTLLLTTCFILGGLGGNVVYASEILAEESADISVSAASISTGTIKLQDASSSVNVRSGASTSYSIVGSLNHGTVVTILGSENGWYKIKSGNVTGYVRGDYVVLGGSSSTVSGTGTIKLQDTSSSVNVRSGCSTSHSIVGSLKHGAVVTILGSENGWYKIKSGTITGYVRADFISLGASSSTGSSKGTVKLQDTSSSVNVRSGASTSYSIVGSLNHGTVVTILGSQNGWYKIKSGNVTGYVRSDFIVYSV